MRLVLIVLTYSLFITLSFAQESPVGEVVEENMPKEAVKLSFTPAIELGFTRVNFGRNLQDSPMRVGFSLYLNKIRFSVSYAQSDLGAYVGPGTDTVLHMPKVSMGYKFPTEMEGMSLVPYVSYLRFEAASPSAGVPLGTTSEARIQASNEASILDELEGRTGFYPGIALVQEVSKDIHVTFEGDVGLFVSGHIGYLF